MSDGTHDLEDFNRMVAKAHTPLGVRWDDPGLGPILGEGPDGAGRATVAVSQKGLARPALAPVLPLDAAERNEYPMADGLLYYFPAALAAVARLSKIGNDQHNPGEPMHWARGKSTDHANKIMKHLLDAGLVDSDKVRHSTKVAWRALAMLQEELEREEGAPRARNAY